MDWFHIVRDPAKDFSEVTNDSVCISFWHLNIHPLKVSSIIHTVTEQAA